MCNATINLISPDGFPIAVTIAPGDDTEKITQLVERVNSVGKYYALKGWHAPEANAVGPSAAELSQGPTFAGYPCSPTVDDRGLPTWLIVNGKQAQRREKQGDVWYSIKLADGEYEQVLRIPKGEQAPAVQGI